ncbi:MAG: nucleotide sugar dehydrogenase [Gammaproteobacteria bacterium]|nr:nucleotide sugar dehydrogenase [Gammaproteobacteria bacterium]
METLQQHAIFKNELLEKIHNHTAKVGIIGLGYVGLPLAVEAASAGYQILGVENNPDRCRLINEGKNYIKDVHDTKFLGLVREHKIQASVGFETLQACDIVVICVPTPLNKNKEPDISYIKNATDGICKNFHPGMLIILESTTYPGTTEEIIQARLEEMGHKLGKDFFLAFSPERVDPGNKSFNTANTTKIVGGVSSDCLELSEAFYLSFVAHVVRMSSPRAAEMTKVFENIYRSVNIALVNELAMLCERMDIDVYEVITAAATKPYGFQAFWPGPGVGGHCIPLDPYYLAWKGKEYDLHARFIELAGEINENMPRVVLAKVGEILNQFSKPVKGAKILQLGISYKKDIDDARESPSVRIYELLSQKGANVEVVDPFVKQFWTREHDFTYGNQGPSIPTIPLSDEKLQEADIVIITTDHTDFPYADIVKKAKVVFDTRNAAGFRKIESSKIFKLSTRVSQNH